MTTEEKAKRFLDKWYATGLEAKIKHSLFNKESLEATYGAIIKTWIARAERRPTEDDLPVILGHYLDSGRWHDWPAMTLNSLSCNYTHWRSVKCEPPPRGLTQREKDDEIAAEVVRRCCWPGAVALSVALQALYAERREVAKLLAAGYCADWGLPPMKWSRELTQLRIRCDEQGG